MSARIVIITCILGFTVLTALVVAGIVPGEDDLVQLALSARGELLTHLIWVLTFISSSVPALLITLLISGIELWRVRRLRLVAAWPTAVYLGNVACNIGTRIAVGRLRPGVEYIPHRLPEVQAGFQRFCYPSGHAGAALLAYASIVMLVWGHRTRPIWRWAVLAGALFVIAGTGFGRVYLGVHWPTDVLGGYLLAGGWLGIGLVLKRWTEPCCASD